jgi:hypothetical protein
MDRLLSLDYDPVAAQRLARYANGSMTGMQDVARIIRTFGYRTLQPGGYSDRSASDAIAAGDVTCLEAALIAHDLASLLGCHRRLMVMNRLDPNTTSYLGHTALVYRAANDLFGAIAVSRHSCQRERAANYASEEAVVLSYAEGYVDLGLVPLSYGLADLDTVAEGLAWRRDRADMRRLHDRLLETQVNSFEIETLS